MLKTAQKKPENKMPFTAAKSTSRTAKSAELDIQLRAYGALFALLGAVSIARNSCDFSVESCAQVSISSEYAPE